MSNGRLQDAFATPRNECIRGLQRGLGPAVCSLDVNIVTLWQTLLNRSRLGFYFSFRRAINCSIGRSITDQIPLTSIVADAASGIIGASFRNSLFLIKVRMQVPSTAYFPILPVGTQHYCKSSFDAPATIFMTDNILPYLASSSVSGICVVFLLVSIMQPADTALTRVYNQPTMRTPDGHLAGTLYKNSIDCLLKVQVVQGYSLRVAPHVIVTPGLAVNDIILGLYNYIHNRRS
ncbi:hypothetical protein BDR03DRAFT_930444 [Suillus americanus]|nr:hypothetical protein BDR03DRAFT_930444 [Suillus americanus]